jgi:hypothetical protein
MAFDATGPARSHVVAEPTSSPCWLLDSVLLLLLLLLQERSPDSWGDAAH